MAKAKNEGTKVNNNVNQNNNLTIGNALRNAHDTCKNDNSGKGIIDFSVRNFVTDLNNLYHMAGGDENKNFDENSNLNEAISEIKQLVNEKKLNYKAIRTRIGGVGKEEYNLGNRLVSNLELLKRFYKSCDSAKQDYKDLQTLFGKNNIFKQISNEIKKEKEKKLDPRPALHNQLNSVLGQGTDAKICKDGKFYKEDGKTEVPLVLSDVSKINNVDNNIQSLAEKLDGKIKAINPESATLEQIDDCNKCISATEKLISNAKDLGKSKKEFETKFKNTQTEITNKKVKAQKNYSDFVNNCKQSQIEAEKNAEAIIFKDDNERKAADEEIKKLEIENEKLMKAAEEKNKKYNRDINKTEKDNKTLSDNVNEKINNLQFNESPTVDNINNFSDNINEVNTNTKDATTKIKTGAEVPNYDELEEIKKNQLRIESLKKGIEIYDSIDKRPELLNKFNQQITGRKTDATKYSEKTGKFTNDKGEEVEVGIFKDDRLSKIVEGVNNINNEILTNIKKNGKNPTEQQLTEFEKNFKDAKNLQNNVTELANSKEHFDKKYNEANKNLDNNIKTIKQNLQDFENTKNNVKITNKELDESEYKEENDVKKLNEKLKEIEEEERKIEENIKKESELAIGNINSSKELNNGIKLVVNDSLEETGKNFENANLKNVKKLSKEAKDLADGIKGTEKELTFSGKIPDIEARKNKIIELEKEKKRIASRKAELEKLNKLSVESFNLRQNALGAGGQMATKYDPVNKVYLNEKNEPIELTNIKANGLSDKFNETTNNLLKKDYDLLISYDENKLKECDKRSEQVANITKLIDETDKSRENFTKKVNESIDKVDEAEKDKENKVNELKNYKPEVTAKANEETDYKNLNTKEEIEEEKKRLTEEYEKKYEEVLENQRKYLNERTNTANNKVDNINNGIGEEGKTRDDDLSTLKNNIKDIKEEYDKEIDDFKLPDQEEYKKKMEQLAKREYQLSLNLDEEIKYLSSIDPSKEDELEKANNQILEKCEKIYKSRETGDKPLTEEEKTNIKYEEAQKSIDKLSPENQIKCAENGVKIMELSPEKNIDLAFYEKQRIYACKVKDCDGKTATNYKDAGIGVKMEDLSPEYLMNVGDVSIGLHSKIKDVSIEDFYKDRGNPPEDKDKYNYSRVTVQNMFEDKEGKYEGYTIDLKYSKDKNSVDINETISKNGFENCGAEFTIRDKNRKILEGKEKEEFLSKTQPKKDTPEMSAWRKERREIIKRENAKNTEKEKEKQEYKTKEKEEDKQKNNDEKSTVDKIIDFIDSLFEDENKIKELEKSKDKLKERKKEADKKIKEECKKLNEKMKEEGYSYGKRKEAIKKVKEEGEKKYNEMIEKEKEKSREEFRKEMLDCVPTIERKNNTNNKEQESETKKEEQKQEIKQETEKQKAKVEKSEIKSQESEPKKIAKDDSEIRPMIKADKTDPLLPPEKQNIQNKVSDLKNESQIMSNEMNRVKQVVNKVGLNKGDVTSVSNKNEKTGPNAGTTIDARDKSQSANKSI